MPKKPLQINPLKLSQPMGALLAFLGIKECMPLMHGSQGCASFSKVFFTRHFNEPIAVQTTAVNDITAVVDGGDYSISEAIKNITKKVKPELVGLFTTGLTEMKGDDIKGVSHILKDKQKIVYVNTPDFEGGLESGWSKSITAIIKQLVEENDKIQEKKVLLIPNVNLTPLEVEKIKDALLLFGLDVLALPDLSESLDGHLGIKQGGLSNDGISVSEIEKLASSEAVITIGRSVEKCGETLLEKNPNIKHFHFDSVSGLKATDEFYEKIMEYTETKTPPKQIIKWRKRLQDALLDTHFMIGKSKIIIADEPDKAYALNHAIREAGGQVEAVVIPTKTELQMDTNETKVGDFEDIENLLKDNDILVSNYHGERIAKKLHKALMLRGFPNFEQVGTNLKNDVLYEGSCYMLFELSNTLMHYYDGH